jgi:hypothetical protein
MKTYVLPSTPQTHGVFPFFPSTLLEAVVFLGVSDGETVAALSVLFSHFLGQSRMCLMFQRDSSILPRSFAAYWCVFLLHSFRSRRDSSEARTRGSMRISIS